MYLSIDEIETIQLDHTSRCNLACPQCARTGNTSLVMTDLTVNDYKIILEPFEKNKLTLFHCGNFGDALASPTFDETFDYCLSQDVKKIKIATNGSLRNPEWWKELAIKSRNKLFVNFSLDGLEDSNHIYRVGSNFKKVIENAKSFIDNGGSAEWTFIEFKHNYHQIEEARKLASDLGFKRFNVKYTARFADQNVVKVPTKTGNIVEETEKNHNREIKKEIVKTHNTFENYAAKTYIHCKYKKDNTVFIDMNMNLWPCCWTAGPKNFNTISPQTESFDHVFSLYGRDFNDMRIYGWDVLNHEFFQKYLENSCNNPDNMFKRIYTCGRTCGIKFEFSSGYGKNIKRDEL